MADHIKVSTEEIVAAINKYNEAQDKLEDAYDQIQAARDHLDNCYKGPAYVALRAKLANIYGNVKSADIAINETITALVKTNNLVLKTETQDNPSKINALDEGRESPVYL